MVEQHPIYYFEGGHHIYQVDDTLYKLHSDMLKFHSAYFEDMLSLNQPSKNANGDFEGLCNEYPIVLSQSNASGPFSSDDFNHFLAWLYPSFSSSVDKDVAHWAAVMKVAHFYTCEAAKIESKKQLIMRAKYMDDRPAVVVAMGLHYKVREWFEQGFRALVRAPFDSLSVEDGEKIGWRVVAAAHKAQMSIQLYRRHLGFLPPAILHHEDCTRNSHQEECKRMLENGWWLEVGRYLLDPEFCTFESCADLKDKLVTFRFPGMTPGCWDRTLAQQASWAHVFDQEEVILSDCIQKVQELVGPWIEI